MTIVIAYGTVEGQTRKIAEFVQNQMRDAGEDTVLFDTSGKTDDLRLDGFDKFVLAASVHEMRHPKTFEAFVNAGRTILGERPTLFLSVSLKAAFADGQEEAQAFADEMKLRTGLNPSSELLVAGAIRTDSYDFYAREVLRHVVLDGQNFDPSIRDHEFTDWGALSAVVADFLAADSHPAGDEG